MNNLEPIEGPNLRLRLIRPEDAVYLYGLRTDPALNQHLSRVDGTIRDQERWIDIYKEREGRREEFYFIIERSDGLPCGVVRIYDFSETSFTWGSWILDKNKPRKAALESAYLVYETAFNSLNYSEARFSVRSENIKTLEFHRRFGATETHADAQDVFFVYPREQFVADQLDYLKILKNERSK